MIRSGARLLAANFRQTAKAHPVWLFGLAALGACGIAWAVVKLMMLAVGGGTALALLRDAGNQVGGGGLPGAGGAGGAAGSGTSGAGGLPSVPTVRSNGPGVQIGKDGSYRDAAPGMQIGPDEFVKVPEGSSVTINRSDGAVQTDTGASLIPGRRLTGDVTPADWFLITTKAIQGVAESILGKQNITTGAGPGGNA